METKETQLKNLLEQTAKEISGTLGISIVEVASGMALSSY
jgi:hypothetical protein